MAKDVIITPASGLIDFKNTAGVSTATIQLSDTGIFSIGNTTSNLYIGDGTNSVDIIFEQNGKIRALTNKTLTLGQSDSYLSVNAPITYVSPDTTKNISSSMLNSGTLSFQGSAGQLFSITNSLSGTIFSVNDVSGMPSIEVLDTGLVKLAQYSGNIILGTATDNATDKLQVNGSISGTVLKSTVAIGTAPFVVTSTSAVANLSIGGNAGTATSIAGQTPYGVLYQTAAGSTASTAASTVAGQVLTTVTAGAAPTWTTPTTGTVTSVGGTAPVASTGGTTPVISMATATTTVSGYLTSTDWNTFNGKTSNTGTVTSVGGTAPVASTGGTTPVISMAAATTSVSGYLTTADWNTFNGKQAAGTYATGTGTASGTNTGDETATTIKTALGITTLSGSNTGDQTNVSGSSGSCTGNAATSSKTTNLVGGNATTLLGSIPYQLAVDTTVLLAPNVTTTKKFLRETGDGTNGTAPAWDTIAIGDLPTVTPAKGGTGITALGTGVATFLGTPSSANLASAVTDETGSGALVFGTSPSLTTPTVSGSLTISGSNGAIKGSYGTGNISSNFAAGDSALSSNTTGINNSAIGATALYLTTTGNNNTAIGNSALRFNTTAVATLPTTFTGGSGYVSGSYNSVVLSWVSGPTALIYPTVNITVTLGVVIACTLVVAASGAFGGSGFSSTTTVMTCTAASLGGSGSGFVISPLSLDISSDNSAIGSGALYSNTTGDSSSAIGSSALRSNTTGPFNSAMGANALRSNTTGGNNSAMGSTALYSNTTGVHNSAIGTSALYSNTTGSSNVGIGYNCASSTTTVSNEVNIYNGSVTARFQGAAIAWLFTSDARDKAAIEDLTLGLDFITQLQPRKFQWAMRSSEVDAGKEAAGFIAQEVLAVTVANNAGYTGLVDTNNPDQYTLAVTNLIPILVNAIKELKTEIDLLKAKV